MTIALFSGLLSRSGTTSVNHLFVVSLTCSDSISMVLLGSSMMNRSPRSPTPMPPTEVASFHPVLLLANLILVNCSLEILNLLPQRFWYRSAVTMLRHLILSRSVRWLEYEAQTYRSHGMFR